MIDDHTILIPDRPGNNRLDTMANITANPNVGCLFFVPGFEDTLRLNGKARITDDAALLAACTVNGKPPKVGILVTVEEVFLHCAKALKRSKLWGAGLPAGPRPAALHRPHHPGADLRRGVDESRGRQDRCRVEGDYRTGLY